MSKVTIYHNPRCSKSRKTLSLLEDLELEVEVINYLQTPPNSERLKDILSKLGIKARELMRRRETLYVELGLAKESLTEEQLINAMSDNPILIERPIVIHKTKCAIGRPPENFLSIL